MKHFIKSLSFIVLFVCLVQSCVDKDYDWDDIDKNGVISIPPVMYGNIDTISLKLLPDGILPDGIPIPDFTLVKSDTIRSLFDGEAVQKFFFDGAGDVEIAATVDAQMQITGLTIDLYFNVIDKNGQKIPSVVIPKQQLKIAKNQTLSIKLASQYMKYMENAKDLELTIVISSAHGTVTLDDEDYIYLRETIVRTGGFHFEL